MKKLACLFLLLPACSSFSPEEPIVELSVIEQLLQNADVNKDGALSAFELAGLALKLREAARGS